MSTDKHMLSPFTLPNGTALKNRLLMAPMTTCTGYFDGTVTEELVEYYRVRAGSIGTIVVECCFIDDLGLAFPGAIGIDNDEKIAGLAKIASAIKGEGSRALLQIYHGGRMVDPKLIGGRTPVAPSALAAPRDGAATPNALTTEEVAGMVGKFGDAVRRAIQAGFDGVEIHGANTYLIQQFYSPNSNQRDDEWGGSRDNRAKFPLAVLDITHQMVRQYADDAFIIGYRFSPEELEVPGIRFDDTMYLLEKLAARGLDYLHFSLGYSLRPSINDTTDPTPLINKYCEMRSEALAQIPVMGVGGIVNASDVETALEHGYDLVAVGRACIAYPDWTARIANGEVLDLFIDSTKREELTIPEPLWRFSLVEAMIRDMSMGGASKFKPGIFEETVSDDVNQLVINVSLDSDRIADIALASGPQDDVEFTTNFEEIRTRILTANSPFVDAISGATSQSEAVKKAVSKAMVKSSKQQAFEESGGVSAPQSYDVVVVGSGGAGLAAAIQAHDEGASVLIVEKMPSIGGNTVKASAGMNAAETRFQRVKGIFDSKELFYAETLKGGYNKNNPELLHRFVENAPQAIEWLADRGIMLNDITTTGGMSIDRTHRPRDGSAVGGYLISGLLRNINKRSIDVLMETAVTDILFEQGAVSGVALLTDENEALTVHAKSVIVATGGFSANSQMVVKYRPDLEGFVTTNHKGATGGGIALLEKLGAGTVDMGEIQIHPTVEQTTSYLISESIRGGGAILVNQKGSRFFNEMETRDKVSAQIIALPEKFAYIVFDENVRTKNKAADEYIAKGFVVSAEGPRELAEKLGMDYHTFLATLERYNGFVENQYDEDFGRKTALRNPIKDGPFHAIRIAPGVHHTMGGVTINAETEVLDKQHQVIPGVFAAGEVAGGIHGGNRIGGNAVADIIVFGTLAGHQAASWAKR
ncbi:MULTISPECIES: flavocytochrome c [Cedecea]|uniref:NADH:flavin oxidoreductase n=1 Tax=Cedecea neteri TaxID=158822 RepID=A0A089Q209_9ENTR|nr:MULTISPECIES: flavocytochrome c [Cedecea]AIR04534.1 NADH:flavin oxidoreductase [Cedecea neteri]NWC63299.1 flavocytochrome c [Cedecea sp. P7760]